MVWLELLACWHYLSLVATVTILGVLGQHYVRAWFFSQKGESSDESV